MAQGTPELIEALGKIDPRAPYGTELFDALARLTVSVAFEAVCLRIGRKQIEGEAFGSGANAIIIPNVTDTWVEVYLVQRAQTDTAYPGEWHCPGSVMRPGENFEDVLARLEAREFGARVLSHRFVANINPSKTDAEVRGTFLSVVYLCVLEEKKGLRGRWFPVTALPPKTVTGHRTRIIPCAVGAFLADQSAL